MVDRKRAIEFYNQAITAAQDKSQPSHLQHAYHLFTSATVADPTYGESWYALGNANNDLNKPLAAIAAWRRALQCDLDGDNRGHCMSNLGWQLQASGQVLEAKTILTHAVVEWPHLGGAWLNLGVTRGVLGDRIGSVEAHRKAIELEPKNALYEFGLALALLFNEEYEEGYRRFESRFEYRLHNFLKYPYPKWDGTPGKTLFLVADQGLGDTLSYARFVEEAAKRCKFIHMLVQKELERSFSQTWSHLPNLNIMPLASPFLEADAWSTFVSLPNALGLTGEQIRSWPQIKMPVYGQSTSWMVPDRKLHIGIAWAGSPLNDIDRYRNIPLEQFLELYRVPGIQLYSLQVGDRARELSDSACTSVIRDLSSHIGDVTATTGLLRDLDLVITVESALGHICAAAGRECWIPYSACGHDYRLGHRGENLLWTPKHRIFQQKLGKATWRNVFEDIAEALQERIDGRAGQVATKIPRNGLGRFQVQSPSQLRPSAR